MTPENAKEIGRLFRQQRQQHGWSVRQLAKRAQLHASTITRLEQGAFLAPKDETVKRIALALAISQADLAAISSRYLLPTDLPELDVYLKVKYPELSKAARDELLQRFTKLHTISQDVAGWEDKAA